MAETLAEAEEGEEEERCLERRGEGSRQRSCRLSRLSRSPHLPAGAPERPPARPSQKEDPGKEEREGGGRAGRVRES